MLAAYFDKTEAVKTLVAERVNKNAVGVHGKKPYDPAIRQKIKDLLKP